MRMRPVIARPVGRGKDYNDRSCYGLDMGNSMATRERILHEGLALASQSGFEGVTLGVLADDLGMSKSGLFAHFNSKRPSESACSSTAPHSQGQPWWRLP